MYESPGTSHLVIKFVKHFPKKTRQYNAENPLKNFIWDPEFYMYISLLSDKLVCTSKLEKKIYFLSFYFVEISVTTKSEWLGEERWKVFHCWKICKYALQTDVYWSVLPDLIFFVWQGNPNESFKHYVFELGLEPNGLNAKTWNFSDTIYQLFHGEAMN